VCSVQQSPMTLDDLKLERRWVLWRLEMVTNGRGELVPTKVPYQVSGAHASSTNPQTWATYEHVMAFVGSYTGVGIMMGDGLGCVDFDHCVDPATCKILPWAREMIIALDSYSEFSPSGTGVHTIITDAALPGKGRKRPWETGAVEVYDRARFLTFTGKHLPKTPAAILPRRSQLTAIYERIDRAARSASKPDFDLLWAGEWQKAGYPSQSEAVFDLVRLLAQKYDNDRERINTAFMESGLYSGKWADGKWERLGAETIEKALAPPEVIFGSPAKAAPKWTLESFNTIQREEIDWIFPGYVARGKVTGLSGEPGTAKSMVTLDWAARYSTGRGWRGNALQPAGKILIFATEDDAGDTILPRFQAAGGDPHNLLRIRLEGDQGFRIDDPGHIEILRAVTEQHPVGMVIIDPILEHLLADKEQRVRAAFSPLRALMEQRRIALVMVIHTNKRHSQNLGSVGDKVGGVKALVGLPRFVYSSHKTDDDVYHLCPIKQNVGKRVTHSMDFRVVPTDASDNPPLRLDWIGEGNSTSGDALTLNIPKGSDGQCSKMLLETLTHDWEKGSVVRDRLRAVYSESTVYRTIAEALVDGRIERKQLGRLTHYRLSNKCAVKDVDSDSSRCA